MSTLTDRKTVGQIAAETPAAVRVFEKYQIDFCCGGKVPLADVATDALLADLEQLGAAAPDGRDWQAAGIDELIDHIIGTHHVYLKTNLPRLSQRMEKVLAAHEVRHGALLRPLAETFEALRQELDSHLMKEEMVLFPMIRRLAAAARPVCPRPPRTAAPSITRSGSWSTNTIPPARRSPSCARLRPDYTPPPDACNTYRALLFELAELEADLHRHIHLENNVLFPRAAALE